MIKLLSLINLLILLGFPSIGQVVEDNHYKVMDRAVSQVVLHPVLQRIGVHQDSRIDSLLNTYTAECKRREGINGYRVEIFFGASRKKALAFKAHFLSKYPDFSAYMKYQTPDFKVRVGDFRTHSEAVKLRELIKRNYPNAFIVKEIIPYPELVVSADSDE